MARQGKDERVKPGLIDRLWNEISESSGKVGGECERAEIDRHGLRVIVSNEKAFRVSPEWLDILRVQHIEDCFIDYRAAPRVAFDDLFIRFGVDGRHYSMYVLDEICLDREGIDFPVFVEVDSVDF